VGWLVVLALEYSPLMHSDPRDVLLVADDPAFAEFAGPLLRERGCSITLVGSAANALHVVDQLRFDLVITRLTAPELDQIGFLNALAERIAGTPVIAIDGRAGIVGHTVATAPATLRGSGIVLSSPVHADDLINTVAVLMAGLGGLDEDEAAGSLTYH
jgi:CheY-like chemotaxis protein